jgi:hypothetical protein
MADIDYTFEGKLSDDCKSLVINYATTIMRQLVPIKDIPLEIHITKFHRQRTAAQNRYIWGYLIVTVRAWMKECTGSCPSKEALYAFFRVHIVGDEATVETIDGQDIIVLGGKRFSQKTTVEFAEDVDKIILYYAEQGLELQSPDPKSNNMLTDFTRNNLKDE